MNGLTEVRPYKRIRNGKIQYITPMPRGKITIRKCVMCGKEFPVTGKSKRKFCSRKCYIDDWKRRIPGWNRDKRNADLGIKVWNTGLNKESDERVRKNIEASTKTIRNQFASGERKVSPKSDKTRKKMGLGKMGDKNPMRIYPELRENQRKVAVKVLLKSKRKRTDIEKILDIVLEKAKIDGIIADFYKGNYTPVDYTLPDAYISERKLAIYADGEHDHTMPAYVERDKRINIWLKRDGYRVYRFWGKEIKSPNFSSVLRDMLLTDAPSNR